MDWDLVAKLKARAVHEFFTLLLSIYLEQVWLGSWTYIYEIIQIFSDKISQIYGSFHIHQTSYLISYKKIITELTAQ